MRRSCFLLTILLYSSCWVIVSGTNNINYNNNLRGKDENIKAHHNNNYNNEIGGGVGGGGGKTKRKKEEKKKIVDSPYQVVIDKVSLLLDRLRNRPENAFPQILFQENDFNEYFPIEIFQNKSKMEELFPSHKRGLCGSVGSGSGSSSSGRGSGRGSGQGVQLPSCHLLRDVPTLPVLHSPSYLLFPPTFQPSIKPSIKTYFNGESEKYLNQIIQDRYGSSSSSGSSSGSGGSHHDPAAHGNHNHNTSTTTNSDSDNVHENCRAYTHHLHNKQKTTTCPANPSERSNLILAHVSSHDNCHQISIFFRTLRDANICANVIIFRDIETTTNKCDMIELSCSTVHVEDNIDLNYPHIDGQYSFSIAALHYLHRHLQLMIRNNEGEEDDVTIATSRLLCKRILLVDVANVFFQTDPFQTFHLDQTDAEVILSDFSFGQDHKFHSIGGSLKEFSQQAFFSHADYSSTVGDLPILNPGIIYGEFFGVFKLLWMTAYVYDRNYLPSSATGPMTALNVMYYSGLLSRIVKVKVLPPSLNFFMEGTFYHPRKQRPNDPFHHLTNPLVNLFGEPYAVVRTYRIWNMMTIVEDWVLQYGGLDWKFNAAAPAKGCEN